jgi:hypothetical protein
MSKRGCDNWESFEVLVGKRMNSLRATAGTIARGAAKRKTK